MENRYLECNCTSIDHLVRFGWFANEEDPEFQYMYVEVQMSPYMGFFGRLWHGIKYILDIDRTGWSETLMFPEDAKKLRGIIDEYISECENEGK